MPTGGDQATQAGGPSAPLSVHFVQLPASGTPTGIRTYCNRLTEQFRGDPRLSWSEAEFPKRELRIGRHSVGGYLSTFAAFLRGAPAKNSAVVHSPHPPFAYRDCNVLTIHDLAWHHFPREYRQARMGWRLMGRWLRRMPAFITPSRTVAEEVHQRLGIARERIHAIPLAPDHATFYPEPGGRRGDGKATLLQVGEFRPRKNTLEILHALRGMAGVRFLHAGPVLTMPEYRAACLAYAQRHAIDFVDLGFVDAAGLRRLYSDCDLFLYPSRYEGFGIPPFEAASCGAPSLLLDAPVSREFWDGRAHFTPGYGPEELRVALQAALDDPVSATMLRDHARRFTWERTAERHVEVYQQVAGRG